MAGLWITEKEIYGKNGKVIEVKKVMIDDQKEASKIIQEEMKLYRTSGQYIYFDKDTKEKVIIPATKDELATALQKFYYKDWSQNFRKWRDIADDIKAWIEIKEQNTRFISFKNNTIDWVESLQRKEVVFLDKVIDVDNTFPFDIEKDQKKWDKKHLKLLNQILGNYTDAFTTPEQKKEWVNALVKSTAYLMTPTNAPFEKAIMFKSKAGTGKSTWLKIMQTVYGTNGQPWDIHNDDSFADTGILGKRFIYMDEMKDMKWQRKTQLQTIISGNNPMNVRYSGGKNISWTPKSKVMLLTNYDVKLESNDAMWPRLYVVPFINVIRGNKKYEIDNLFNKVSDPKFISFFLSFMVKVGLPELLKSGLKMDKTFLNVLKNGSKENVINDFYNEIVNDEITHYFKGAKKTTDRYTRINTNDLFLMFGAWMKDNNERNSWTKNKFKKKFDQYVTPEQVCKNRLFEEKVSSRYELSIKEKELEKTIKEVQDVFAEQDWGVEL